jgi:hypothetical protein
MGRSSLLAGSVGDSIVAVDVVERNDLLAAVYVGEDVILSLVGSCLQYRANYYEATALLVPEEWIPIGVHHSRFTNSQGLGSNFSVYACFLASSMLVARACDGSFCLT